MAFVVVYDACVLYPVVLRDLFIRMGQVGLFRARWSERILDEFSGAILRTRPELRESLERQRQLMNQAVRDALVTGVDRLLPGVPALPDPGDAHVVAAAMAAGAEVIVTFNTAHFPAQVLAPLQLEAQHPDVFVRHLIDLDREAVAGVVEQMASAKKKPPMTYDAVLDSLASRGLVQSAGMLR